MRRILKFVVPPDGADIATGDEPRWLAAGVQGDDVVAWAEAEVGNAVLTRIMGVLTGQDAPPVGQAFYVGTVQMPDGIVVHVYVGRPWHGGSV